MATNPTYIDVAIALKIYHSFTYSVPENLSHFVSPGKRVLVPLGQRSVMGYILGVCERPNKKETKHILDVLDENPLFHSSMIPLFKWISDYYIYPLGEVIKCALPGGLSLSDHMTIVLTKEGEDALCKAFLTPLEREILGRLKLGTLRVNQLRKILNTNIPAALIQTLENRGWLVKKKELKGGKAKPRLERYVSLRRSDVPADSYTLAGKKIIRVLKAEGEISVKNLKKVVPSAPRIIKSLEDAGDIAIYEKRLYRDPFGEPIQVEPVPVLTKEQKNVVESAVFALGKGFSTFLLTGVTGSGKTEVYLHLAAEAIKREYPVLVLVPEIALMSQMERRFRARFGECIAVLHSGLSTGERFDQWMRIIRKEAIIAIGARSAIFAPFENIGVIIVDEEHDTSYKQDGHLHYNARDLAVVRAKHHNCVALLGSATPSIQSYHNVIAKKFTELTLQNRVEARPLPEITVVDLCQTRDTRGIRRFISTALYEGIKKTLERNEQVLLFLNRRGFASFSVCGACGEPIRCKNCDISLTLHQRANAYKCHYCGFTRASTSDCSACGSSRIKLLGIGTEKIEMALKTLFPEARVARMDRDTTTRKGSILKILKDLKNQSIDILVGTQIVAKGHDFPNITLVGIICADLSLNFPDFRAGERTFQILAQVAGRAGRGPSPGKVILQTYNPDHFSILAAKDQNFRNFYNKEINYRKALNYPPFSRMIQIKITGRDKKKVEQHAMVMGNLFDLLKQSNRSYLALVEILGPIEAPLARIAKQYRWQIILKGLKVKPLHRFVRQLLFENPSILNNRNVKVVVDVDPFFMM